MRPKIRDKLGNNTAAPEGALVVSLVMPDGSEMQLKPNIYFRSGLTHYDTRFVRCWVAIPAPLRGVCPAAPALLPCPLIAHPEAPPHLPCPPSLTLSAR